MELVVIDKQELTGLLKIIIEESVEKSVKEAVSNVRTLLDEKWITSKIAKDLSNCRHHDTFKAFCLRHRIETSKTNGKAILYNKQQVVDGVEKDKTN